MLQFWKKSVYPTEIRTSISPPSAVELNTTSALANYATGAGQKEKEGTNKSPGTSPAKSPKHGGTSLLSNGEAPSIPGDGFNPCLVGPLVGFNEEEAGDDDGDLPACSRLSKNLVEVLTDKGALSYYIQYLDACEAASLVRFWLDVESFRSAVLNTPTRVSLTYEQLEGTTPHCKSTKETADKLICPDTPLKPPIQQEESTLEPCNTCEPSQSTVPVCDHKADSGIRPAPQDLDSRSINLCKCGRYILNSDSDAVISISNCKHILNNISMEMGDQVVSDSASAGSRSEADISRDGPQDGRSSDTSPKSPCHCYDVAQSSVNDAIRIYRTYIGHGATHPIPLSEEVKTRVAATICVQDSQLDPECFTEAQNIIYQIMDKEYINDFLRSEFHCKHQIDVLTSSKVTLFDILYNDTALFYFMELEFWLAAVNFRQQLLNKVDNYDPMEAQNDAMILYDKFFSLQATSPLGFNDRVRIEMEHNICREEGPLPDCFQKPVKIVTKVLEKNFLQPFLTSQLYFRYLSELINTIQANPPLLTRHRRTGSECSSEFSISTQNTLLAMEDSAPPRKILRNVDHHELSIDLQQLYDPDSLWRRRHHNSHKHVELGGLSFGRINEMGRFETDFEPEPGKKGESKITKVMKKLVNMEEDKAKEEVAWQIAEQIVKDITSLTLGVVGARENISSQAFQDISKKAEDMFIIIIFFFFFFNNCLQSVTVPGLHVSLERVSSYPAENGVLSPVDLLASYYGVLSPVDSRASYDGVLSPVDSRASYDGVLSPVDSQASYD
uniref:RGS domain-containing protein n=1 Tax=Timema cristinae TaxID=61476 RepID=A0A7R9D6D4_TIMCR|nr:unnamed protein product [Timema cristinae]